MLRAERRWPFPLPKVGVSHEGLNPLRVLPAIFAACALSLLWLPPPPPPKQPWPRRHPFTPLPKVQHSRLLCHETKQSFVHLNEENYFSLSSEPIVRSSYAETAACEGLVMFPIEEIEICGFSHEVGLLLGSDVK